MSDFVQIRAEFPSDGRTGVFAISGLPMWGKRYLRSIIRNLNFVYDGDAFKIVGDQDLVFEFTDQPKKVVAAMCNALMLNFGPDEVVYKIGDDCYTVLPNGKSWQSFDTDSNQVFFEDGTSQIC